MDKNVIRSGWKERLHGKLSGWLIAAFAGELHHDEQGISEVFEAMLNPADKQASHNAAWLLAHLSKEDKNVYLAPRYDELVDISISSEAHENRALLFAVLVDMPELPGLRADLLDFCLQHIPDVKMSNSCRSYMIRLAVRMCVPYPELAHELTVSLEMLPPGLSPSIASAARSALTVLHKNLMER